MILAGTGSEKVAGCKILSSTVVIKEGRSSGRGRDDPCGDKVAHYFKLPLQIINKIYCYVTSTKANDLMLLIEVLVLPKKE